MRRDVRDALRRMSYDKRYYTSWRCDCIIKVQKQTKQQETEDDLQRSKDQPRSNKMYNPQYQREIFPSVQWNHTRQTIRKGHS